jgi:hypothetical protein
MLFLFLDFDIDGSGSIDAIIASTAAIILYTLLII